MKMRMVIPLVVVALELHAVAATNSLAGLLQRGLFEEEANRNFPAAIQAYESLIAAFDADRKLAATAVFRLGECYRKQGRTNDAVVQYDRVAREFADQSHLAELSRQNLSTLRPAGAAVASAGANAAQIRLLQEEIDLVERQLIAERKKFEAGAGSTSEVVKTERELLALKRQLETLKSGGASDAIPLNAYTTLRNTLDRFSRMSPAELRIAIQQEFRDPVFSSTMQRLSEAEVKLAELKQEFAPEHPEVKAQVAAVKALEQQLDMQVQGMLGGLRAKLSELAPADPVVAAPGEAAEVARIRSLIQNSPDLINAPQKSGETLLETAAAQGNLAVAGLLLDNGAAVNGVRQPALTPLHYSAGNARNSMVQLLLSRGANVNAQTSAGVTPLHVAVHKGYETVVSSLLEAGATPSAKTSRAQDWTGENLSYNVAAGQAPLHLAAISGYAGLVRLLSTNQVELNALDARGYTALAYGVQSGSLPVVQILLEAGADPNLGTTDSPVALAARNGQVEILKFLLGKGADPKAESALYGAVRQNQAEAVRELLARGADPNIPGPEGSSLLLAALKSPEMLEALLKAGADPNGRGSRATTVLVDAINGVNTNAVRLLLEHGADPNAVVDAGNDRYTALHVAIQNPQIARMLLEKGADPETKYRDDTPLHTAVHAGAADTVQVLLSHKADPNAVGKDNQTPLEIVKRLRSQSLRPPREDTFRRIEELLRQHGALDIVPRFDRIQVRRPNTGWDFWVNLPTNAWCRFTALEVLGLHYQLLSRFPQGENRTVSSSREMGSVGLAYPNLGAILLRTPAADARSWSERKVDLVPILASGACEADVPVSVGDVLEIPERDHPMNEPWGFFGDQELRNLQKCLSRTVRVSIKGTVTPVVLAPTIVFPGIPGMGPQITKFEPFWIKPVLQSSPLVLASSDLSRVKVTRTSAEAGATMETIVDCTANAPAPEIWLKDGDLIEIPERQN